MSRSVRVGAAKGLAPCCRRTETQPCRFASCVLPVTHAGAGARWSRTEGTVLLRLSIAAVGTVQDVKVAQSSGNDLLDEAARKTLRRWRFAPARHGSTAVPSTALVPVAFKLEERRS